MRYRDAMRSARREYVKWHALRYPGTPVAEPPKHRRRANGLALSRAALYAQRKKKNPKPKPKTERVTWQAIAPGE